MSAGAPGLPCVRDPCQRDLRFPASFGAVSGTRTDPPEVGATREDDCSRFRRRRRSPFASVARSPGTVTVGAPVRSRSRLGSRPSRPQSPCRAGAVSVMVGFDRPWERAGTRGRSATPKTSGTSRGRSTRRRVARPRKLTRGHRSARADLSARPSTSDAVLQQAARRRHASPCSSAERAHSPPWFGGSDEMTRRRVRQRPASCQREGVGPADEKSRSCFGS